MKSRSPMNIRLDQALATSKTSIQLLSNRSRKDHENKSLKFSEVQSKQLQRKSKNELSQMDIRVVSRRIIDKSRQTQNLQDLSGGQQYDEISAIEERIRKIEQANTHTPQYIYEIKEEYRNAFKELVAQINSRFLSVDKHLHELQQENTFANKLISACNVAQENVQKQLRVVFGSIEKEKERTGKLQSRFMFELKDKLQSSIRSIELRQNQQIELIKNKLTVQAAALQEQLQPRHHPLPKSDTPISNQLYQFLNSSIKQIQSRTSILQRQANSVQDRLSTLRVGQESASQLQQKNKGLQQFLMGRLEQLSSQLRSSCQGMSKQLQQLKQNIRNIQRDSTEDKKKHKKTQESFRELSQAHSLLSNQVSLLKHFKQLLLLFDSECYLLDKQDQLLDLNGNVLMDISNKPIILQEGQKEALKEKGLLKNY